MNFISVGVIYLFIISKKHTSFLRWFVSIYLLCLHLKIYIFEYRNKRKGKRKKKPNMGFIFIHVSPLPTLPNAY